MGTTVRAIWFGLALQLLAVALIDPAATSRAVQLKTSEDIRVEQLT